VSARSSVVNGSLRGAKERRSFKPKVAGSTPVGRTDFSLFQAVFASLDIEKQAFDAKYVAVSQRRRTALTGTARNSPHVAKDTRGGIGSGLLTQGWHRGGLLRVRGMRKTSSGSRQPSTGTLGTREFTRRLPRQTPYKRTYPSGRVVWIARYLDIDGKACYAKPKWHKGKSSFKLRRTRRKRSTRPLQISTVLPPEY
jgi:hypothetical protein